MDPLGVDFGVGQRLVARLPELGCVDGSDCAARVANRDAPLREGFAARDRLRHLRIGYRPAIFVEDLRHYWRPALKVDAAPPLLGVTASGSAKVLSRMVASMLLRTTLSVALSPAPPSVMSASMSDRVADARSASAFVTTP